MGEVLVQCLRASSQWHWCGGTTSTGDFDPQGRPLALQDAAVDTIIDFSTPAANAALAATLRRAQLDNKSVLIATTGLDASQLRDWRELSVERRLRVLLAPNTSIGIALLVESALTIMQTCGTEFDVELTEAHHRHKKDAPSGTALYIAERLCQQDARYVVNKERRGPRQPHEIGISAVRGGRIYGEHRLVFLGDNEEISITHRALTRDLFASGALRLAAWLHQREYGFYTLQDVKLTGQHPTRGCETTPAKYT